jgi:arsenate reductase (glutaredoxin)
MAITIYGIPNCDTVKKARVWLDSHGLDYAFHDYKKMGAPADLLAGWVEQFGWETIVNRAGLTYKKLPDADKVGIDPAKAIALMQAHTSMIKRPIAVHEHGVLVGFKPDEWAGALV